MENMNMKTASVRQLHGVRLRVSWRAVASLMTNGREICCERIYDIDYNDALITKKENNSNNQI